MNKRSSKLNFYIIFLILLVSILLLGSFSYQKYQEMTIASHVKQIHNKFYTYIKIELNKCIIANSPKAFSEEVSCEILKETAYEKTLIENIAKDPRLMFGNPINKEKNKASGFLTLLNIKNININSDDNFQKQILGWHMTGEAIEGKYNTESTLVLFTCFRLPCSIHENRRLYYINF